MNIKVQDDDSAAAAAAAAQVQNSQPVEGSTATEEGVDLSVSTVQKSDRSTQEAAAQANAPSLVMSTLLRGIEQTPSQTDAVVGLDKTAQAVLDSWLDGIERDKIRREEERKSLSYLILEEAKSPQAIAKQEEIRGKVHNLQDQISLRAGFSEGVRNMMIEGDKNQLPFMAASIVVSTTFIGETLTAREVPNATAMNATAFEQLYEHAKVAISDDMRAELGLIGALFARSMIYPAAAEAGATTANTLEVDNNFAKNYAKNLIKLVMGDQIDLFLTPVLANKLGGKDAANADPAKMEKIKQHIATVKIMLLASALAIHYKITQGAHEGKITGQEFADMLSGELKMDLPPEMQHARTQMNKLLDSLPIEKQDQLWTAIVNYMNSNPSVKSMLRPAQLFAGINQTAPREISD